MKSKGRKSSFNKASPDAQLIESLVYGLRETVEKEILSRDKMVKLIEAELFNLRTVQKELAGNFHEIDARIAKMITFLNTFPDRIGVAVTAALQGRGWGDPIPVDTVEKGVVFMAKGRIDVGGKPEGKRTMAQGEVPPGRFNPAGPRQVQVKLAKAPKLSQTRMT